MRLVQCVFFISLILFLNSFVLTILHNEVIVDVNGDNSNNSDDLNQNDNNKNSVDTTSTAPIVQPESTTISIPTPLTTVIPNPVESELSTDKQDLTKKSTFKTTSTSTVDTEVKKPVETSATEPSVVPETSENTESTTTVTEQPVVETKTPPIVVGVVVNKADMQSFEEWKEMKLKNAAKQSETQINNQNIKKQTQNGNPPNPSNSLVTTPVSDEASTIAETKASEEQAKSDQDKKASIVAARRKNYASIDCGAKIIANNPESSNPSHILSESKDDYMLNSCSARAWFVIELCEPIKVTEIELANLELFSNVPKQFKVYASERYLPNANNWNSKYLLGTFEAANSRSIQTFFIKDAIYSTGNNDSSSQNQTTQNNNNNRMNENKNEQSNSGANSTQSMPASNMYIMYAKFVKFEMISHYGTEHFCPLSLVRVFGTSMVDEEDDALNINNDIGDESSIGSGQIIDQLIIDEIEKGNNQENSGDFSTGRVVIETGADKLITLNQDDTIKIEDGSDASIISTEPADPPRRKRKTDLKYSFLNNLISVFLGNKFDLSKIFGSKAKSKIEIKDNFNNNFIKLNQRPSKSTRLNDDHVYDTTNETKRIKNTQPDAPVKNELLNKRNTLLQIDLSKLFCMHGIDAGVCCKCDESTDENDSNRSSTFNWLHSSYCGYYFLVNMNIQAQTKNSLLINYLKNIKFKKSLISLLNDSTEDPAGNYTNILLNHKNYFILNKLLDYRINIMDNHLNNESAKQKSSDVQTDQEDLSSNDKDKTESEKETDKKLIVEISDEKKEEPSVVKSQPEPVHETTTEKSATDDKDTHKKEQISETTEPVNAENEVNIDEAAKQSQPSETNEIKQEISENNKSDSIGQIDEVKSEEGSTSTSSNNQDTTTTQQAPPVITPIVIANGKDAMFMRLNNRIKILELNMSLSSQYLEKLSQHYKKQMDEMQKAFNLTTTALIETIRIADERDVKQNEKINIIEKKTEKLQQTVDSLNNYLLDLKLQTDLIMWTVIVIFSVIIAVELIRCFKSIFFSTREKKIEKERAPTANLVNYDIEKLFKDEEFMQKIDTIVAKQVEMIVENRIRNYIDTHKKDLIKEIQIETCEASQDYSMDSRSAQMYKPTSMSNSSNSFMNSNLSSSELQQQQQQAVVSSTLAMVANVVSLAAVTAATNATCQSLNKVNKEDIMDAYQS